MATKLEWPPKLDMKEAQMVGFYTKAIESIIKEENQEKKSVYGWDHFRHAERALMSFGSLLDGTPSPSCHYHSRLYAEAIKKIATGFSYDRRRHQNDTKDMWDNEWQVSSFHLSVPDDSIKQIGHLLKVKLVDLEKTEYTGSDVRKQDVTRAVNAIADLFISYDYYAKPTEAAKLFKIYHELNGINIRVLADGTRDEAGHYGF